MGKGGETSHCLEGNALICEPIPRQIVVIGHYILNVRYKFHETAKTTYISGCILGFLHKRNGSQSLEIFKAILSFIYMRNV